MTEEAIDETGKGKKEPEYPTWFEDFRAASKDAIKKHWQEIVMEAEKIKKSEQGRVFEEFTLLFAAAASWMKTNGTDEQKRISETWINNMYNMARQHVAPKLEKEMSLS